MVWDILGARPAMGCPYSTGQNASQVKSLGTRRCPWVRVSARSLCELCPTGHRLSGHCRCPCGKCSHIPPRETVRKAILCLHHLSPRDARPSPLGPDGKSLWALKGQVSRAPPGSCAAAGGWGGGYLRSTLVQERKKGRHAAITGSKLQIPQDGPWEGACLRSADFLIRP